MTSLPAERKPVHIGVHEAKTQFSNLLRRIEAGEEFVITRHDQPLARLVPLAPAPSRTFGEDHGAFVVPDDFNAPLPEDILAAFE